MRFLVSFLLVILSSCITLHTRDSDIAEEVNFLVWSYQRDDIDQLCSSAIDSLEGEIARIKQAGIPDFQNTVQALDTALSVFRTRVEPLAFYSYVHENPGIRDAAKNCELKIEKFDLQIFSDAELYARFSSVTMANPTKPQIALIEDFKREFHDKGLHLPADKRKKLLQLRSLEEDLKSKFTSVLTEWNEKLEFPKKSLDGLPEGLLTSLEPGQAKDSVVLTLKYPHVIPTMEMVHSSSVRQQVMTRFNQIGGEQNVATLEKALLVRAEIASLLGYKNFSELTLAKNMAKTPEAVSTFLTKLEKRLRSSQQADLKALLKAKQKDFPKQKIKRLEPWDMAYYAKKVQEQTYQFDQEEIRQYFPVDHVIQGLFTVYQNLLSLDFEERKQQAWHSDVRFFLVKDRATKEVLGGFYMDLFPRAGKYGHAAAFSLKRAFQSSRGYEKPVSAIVCNFSLPTATTPSLLTHDEVETFFHEFGHIMHQVVTTSKFGRISGTEVKRDFVEAPSQMLENWVWQDIIIKVLSSHYQTKATLPPELLTKLVASRRFNIASETMRQIFLAKVDQAYHSFGPQTEKINSTQIWRDLYRKTLGFESIAGGIPQAKFGHLMAGYEAGYYGYLWSKVYAQDMFSVFSKGGILNPELGIRYRKWILEKGGEQDPLILIEKFLQRKSSEEAFLADFAEVAKR